MQILVRIVIEVEPRIHTRILPAEILRHKALLVFARRDFGVWGWGEECPLELVENDRLGFNSSKIFEVYQLDLNLAIYFLHGKLTLFNQLDSFSFASSKLICIARIEAKVLKDFLVPMLLIEHLSELFLVLLRDNVALDLFGRDGSLLGVG